MKLHFFRKKSVLVCFLLSTMTASVYAEQYDCIVVHMKAGNKVFVHINEHPKITFENQMISVNTEQYLISNISKYTFANYAQSIESATTDRGMLFTKEGHVFVQVNNPKSVINVYSIDGKVLKTDIHVSTDNTADIDLSDFPQGVYLLSIDGETLKIQRQ